jgi:hypothetical protein
MGAESRPPHAAFLIFNIQKVLVNSLILHGDMSPGRCRPETEELRAELSR